MKDVLADELKGHRQDTGFARSSDGRGSAYFSQEKVFRLNLAMGTDVEVATSP